MIMSFKPIIDENCKILILGTMPGAESLRKQQYYGYKRNHFWTILFSIFNEEMTEDYDKKTQFLLKHHIALWDVLKSCEREGSSDSKIKNEENNDIQGLLSKFPQIRYICFNGKGAEKLFKKLIGNKIERSNIKFYSLPSTSPAYTIKVDEKLKMWKSVLLVTVNSEVK